MFVRGNLYRDSSGDSESYQAENRNERMKSYYEKKETNSGG